MLVQELLARYPDYEVVEDGLEREVSEFHVGWARMPISRTVWAYGESHDAAHHRRRHPPHRAARRVDGAGAGQVAATEVPHVVRNDEGRDVWVLDGTPF